MITWAVLNILLGDPDFSSCFVSSLNGLESPVTTAWLQILDGVLGSPLHSFASQDLFCLQKYGWFKESDMSWEPLATDSCASGLLFSQVARWRVGRVCSMAVGQCKGNWNWILAQTWLFVS